jgi:hypothetical protein
MTTTFDVYYVNDENFSNFITGNNLPDITNLEKTHVNVLSNNLFRTLTIFRTSTPFPDVFVNLKTDKEICERLYSILNRDYEHPLGTKKIQDRLKDNKVHHTSMSVGDVIKINNSFYICRKMGFSKIIQDEELSADLETTTELLNQNS